MQENILVSFVLVSGVYCTVVDTYFELSQGGVV